MFGDSGSILRRMSGMMQSSSAARRHSIFPTNHQTVASLCQLLSEARDLSRRAQDLDLKGVEPVTRQRWHSDGTAATSVSLAFQGSLARETRKWLRRAELAARMTKTDRGVIDDPLTTDLLNQLRPLIDTANAAILRRSKNSCGWERFCSAADRAEGPAALTRRHAEPIVYTMAHRSASHR